MTTGGNGHALGKGTRASGRMRSGEHEGGVDLPWSLPETEQLAGEGGGRSRWERSGADEGRLESVNGRRHAEEDGVATTVTRLRRVGRLQWRRSVTERRALVLEKKATGGDAWQLLGGGA